MHHDKLRLSNKLPMIEHFDPFIILEYFAFLLSKGMEGWALVNCGVSRVAKVGGDNQDGRILYIQFV